MTYDTQTIDTIVSALKDILKFKVIQNVSTGDKTLDSLVNTFLVALIGLVFSLFSYDAISIKYQLWKHQKNIAKMDIKTKNYYKEYIDRNIHTFTCAIWHINDTKDSILFTSKMIYYFNKHYPLKSWSGATIIDTSKYSLSHKHKGIENSCFESFKRTATCEDRLPIYIDANGIVAITGNNDGIVLIYNNVRTFNKFMEVLKSIPISDTIIDNSDKDEKYPDGEEKKLCIFSHNADNVIGGIYKDRNFNNFISRHKQMILNKIDNFINTNSRKSPYNGYSNYNLGFILYGKPGTGKTMFIKAICNKLKRFARIIDMRLVKTRMDFEKIFLNYKRYVYVLDEFDCVQGVIKSREMKADDTAQPNPLTELRERQLSILNMIANRPLSSMGSLNKQLNDKSEESDPLIMELNNIRNHIKEIENSLNLDTILTVLEGMCEMRGRVIIAATNYIDKIDAALLREGRFDEKIELTEFNDAEIKEMLKKIFYDTATPEELAMIDQTNFKEDLYTPTSIIGLVSKYKDLSKIISIMKK